MSLTFASPSIRAPRQAAAVVHPPSSSPHRLTRTAIRHPYLYLRHGARRRFRPAPAPSRPRLFRLGQCPVVSASGLRHPAVAISLPHLGCNCSFSLDTRHPHPFNSFLLIHLADILAKLNVYKQVGFIARKQCGTIQPYLIGFLSSSFLFPLVLVRTKGGVCASRPSARYGPNDGQNTRGRKRSVGSESFFF
jgi:hypothetical protein